MKIAIQIVNEHYLNRFWFFTTYYAFCFAFVMPLDLP